ncbi:MAG: FAD-binding oxidoreductase [Phycisphaerales bacterium]|nr:FAD-binding oxidoreductase [Phycisphaerales bacterium]
MEGVAQEGGAMNAHRDVHLSFVAPSRTQQRRTQIADALAQKVSGEIRFAAHDRMLYATDASIYQVEPIGVVIPSSVADGVVAVEVCADLGVAILARGGGTALAGQTVNEAVVIDFSANCRGINQVDPVERTVRVEPGVVLDQLNRTLAPLGLMFGPDVATSSHATIGGMIGNNSAGANSILYGRTVEHLVAVDVILSDGSRMHFAQGQSERDPRIAALTRKLAEILLPIAGEIEHRTPKIRRHVDGYNFDILIEQMRASTPGTFDRVNLAHLVCGSEGTLAIILQAQLALVAVPKFRGLAIFGFDGVREALAPLMGIIATKPSAVELIDDMVISMARKNPSFLRDVEVLPQPPSGCVNAVMYVQYFADSKAELDEKMALLGRALPGVPMVRHFDAVAMDAAWRIRKAGEPLLHGIPGIRRPVTFVEDTAVDPSRLGEFVEEFRAIVARHGSTAAYYAHASVGCLHIRPLVAIGTEEGLATMRAIAIDVADLVVKYGGALSGEHGDGRVRSPLLTRVLGPVIAQAIRDVKKLFDPQGLLNPGNLVNNDDPRQITSKLRVRPDDAQFVHLGEVETFFRYDREEGFGHALEQCNGAGLCRRLTPGSTMCPSYRVLKDERHATRGRANALRLAVSGQFGSGDATSAKRWSDPETKATLELCLSCKSCKTECPSNVDISKLKAEFTAQEYWRRGGVPWRVRAMANVQIINRLGSAIWPIASALVRQTPVRALVAALLGMSSKRSLPQFGPALRSWMERRAKLRVQQDGPRSLQEQPTVLLLPDCFTQWSTPEVGRAAVEVLEAFGYRVVLPHAGCCGRAAISCGMLADAARTTRATATALLDAMRREGAVAILALEPSCLSAIKDDWLELKMGVDLQSLRGLASKSWMIEEFLNDRWESHPIRPAFAHTRESILLHAHCHQKALWGAGTSLGLLQRIFPNQVEALATGCCGMAGGFGFREQSYDLSMRIGEQDLFPAIRAHDDSIVCAPGSSCRHQVTDGTARTALHPIELVARAMQDCASS